MPKPRDGPLNIHYLGVPDERKRDEAVTKRKESASQFTTRRKDRCVREEIRKKKRKTFIRSVNSEESGWGTLEEVKEKSHKRSKHTW